MGVVVLWWWWGGGRVGVFLGVAEQLTSGDNVGKEILFCFVWLFTW